jgi:hypothetical protein
VSGEILLGGLNRPDSSRWAAPSSEDRAAAANLSGVEAEAASPGGSEGRLALWVGAESSGRNGHRGVLGECNCIMLSYVIKNMMILTIL